MYCRTRVASRKTLIIGSKTIDTIDDDQDGHGAKSAGGRKPAAVPPGLKQINRINPGYRSARAASCDPGVGLVLLVGQKARRSKGGHFDA